MFPWDKLPSPSFKFGPKVLERLMHSPARSRQGHNGCGLILSNSNQVGHIKSQGIIALEIYKYVPTYLWLIVKQVGHIIQVGHKKSWYYCP